MTTPSTPAAKTFIARPASPRRAQRGVALIEAPISILIFSFGVLGIMGLEARAINTSVESEDRNRAALFASEIASSMWLAGTVTPTSASYLALKASVANTATIGVPGGTITTTQVGTSNATDIVITWRSPSRAASEDASVLTTRVILP